MGSSKHDFEQIRDSYLNDYKRALQRGVYKLGFDLADWYSTLSEVQRKVYEDIKYIGAELYPIYPVGKCFIDFGNPFKKVGIVVLYKEFEREERLQNIRYLELEGWTVYPLESKAVYLTADALYDSINKKSDYDFYSDPSFIKFISEYKDQNSQCLIYYIKQRYLTYQYEEDFEE